ncbi:MAG: Uma2 family endonuclease [Acidimicrobiales bacterium]
MAVVTAGRTGTGPVGPGPGAVGAFTWDDLQHAPDDSLRRELVGGQLLVTPAPAGLHQRAVAKLSFLLQSACPHDFEVFLSPSDWKLSATTVFQPDLMVIRKDEFNPVGAFTGTPLLVVEVRSPATAATDRTLKREQYARHGAVAYWLVDPGGPAAGQVPSLTALHLADGAYAEVATVHGDEPFSAEHPFPVTVVPSRLVR